MRPRWRRRGPSSTPTARYQTLLDLYLNQKPGDETQSPIGRIVETTMAKIKTPKDLLAATTVMTALSQVVSGEDSRLVSSLQNQLNGLLQMQQEIEAGNFSRVLSNYSSSYDGAGPNPYQKQLQAIRTELRQKALLAAIAGGEKSADSPVRAAVDEIMKRVKGPADLAAAVASIAELSNLSYGNNESRLVNNVQNQLGELAQLNAELEAGNYGRVVSSYTTSYVGSSSVNPYARQLQVIRDQLRVRAVALANDLPDLGTPPAGESFAAFIRKQSEEAFAKKDWQQLFTLLTVYSSATGGGCARTEDMKSSVAAYLAGMQLEEAQQFGDAVQEYTRCVAKIGKFVPRAEAKEALTRLRQSHPEAFSPTGNR